jgi:hypothetical protein
MKAFPGEKTFTPPSALGLQPPLQRLAPLPRPEPAPLPVEQPWLGKVWGNTTKNAENLYFSIEHDLQMVFFRGFFHVFPTS